MQDNLEQEIVKIIAEILEVDPSEVTPQGTIGQILQIDSLALLEIMVVIERTYGIDINEDELQEITQLNQLIELVRKKIQQ